MVDNYLIIVIWLNRYKYWLWVIYIIIEIVHIAKNDGKSELIS